MKHEGRRLRRSRESTEVLISRGGLVTIIGGKWTTYRRMAEDVVDNAIDVGCLERRPCVTESLRLRGWIDRDDPAMPTDNWLRVYGADSRGR